MSEQDKDNVNKLKSMNFDTGADDKKGNTKLTPSLDIQISNRSVQGLVVGAMERPLQISSTSPSALCRRPSRALLLAVLFAQLPPCTPSPGEPNNSSVIHFVSSEEKPWSVRFRPWVTDSQMNQ
jgi:hypothetical protein